MGVSQIANALNMPVSSTHDNLATMVELGYLEQDAENRRYRLSVHFFDIIQNFASSFDIVEKVKNKLQQLALEQNQTLYLCTLWHEYNYVISVYGAVGGSSALGTSGPAYTSSAGKIMVAQLPENEWEKFAPKPDAESRTPSTNMDKDVFFQELHTAQKTGFAWSREESAANIYSVATILPFREKPYRYALALVTFKDEMINTQETELEETLKNCVESLTKELDG